MCPTLHDPMDCSPPGSSAPGILQAGAREWVPLPPPLIFYSPISSLISPWHLNFYIPETFNYLHLSVHLPHAILYIHHLLTVFIFLTWINSDVTSSSKSSVQTKREPPFCSSYRSRYYHPLSAVTARTSERPKQLLPRPAQ